jgi:hypothetical protein
MCCKGTIYKADYQILSFLRLFKDTVFGSKTALKSFKPGFCDHKKNYKYSLKNRNFDPSR